MVTAYLWQKIKENSLRIELLPQFLTESHKIWYTHWSWWEDVQDIFFGCVGSYVAMETAYVWQ